MSLRRHLSQHALGLWFLGLAALGLLRFWMGWREADGAALAIDGWLWLAGGAACTAVGCLALIRSRHR